MVIHLYTICCGTILCPNCAEGLQGISANGTPPVHKNCYQFTFSSLVGSSSFNLATTMQLAAKAESISQSRSESMHLHVCKMSSASNTTHSKINHCAIFLTHLCTFESWKDATLQNRLYHKLVIIKSWIQLLSFRKTCKK
jgi:hypothetical protein